MKLQTTLSCPDGETEIMDYLTCRAEQIFAKILQHGAQQVRIDGSRVLSFKYPAPRGYGVRGILVGVYGKEVNVNWIRDDLVSLIIVLDDTEASKPKEIAIDCADAAQKSR
jgi:hypothetical protein